MSKWKNYAKVYRAAAKDVLDTNDGMCIAVIDAAVALRASVGELAIPPIKSHRRRLLGKPWNATKDWNGKPGFQYLDDLPAANSFAGSKARAKELRALARACEKKAKAK